MHHHIVIDGDDVHLFDGGFLGGLCRIRKALKKRGMDLSNVRSLVLTHGHLDHTLNVARIQKLTGCTVYAPRLDQAHVEGRYHHQGWTRLCGSLEFMGRFFLQFSPPPIDDWFKNGEVFLNHSNGIPPASLAAPLQTLARSLSAKSESIDEAPEKR